MRGSCASAALCVVDGHEISPGTDSGADSQKKYTLPGSRRSFTQVEQQSFYDPADWYPEDHPAMPLIVAKGRESASI